ncbi:hypothetical protein BGX38DRAFT_1329566 [Terfezia claveryi]|nr:hypothetical protein BGX38DRAFT_1329566 [Terfezia claveryi]
MPQRKRKDNTGKLDKRNPPLKTRLPVTGHPATVTTPDPDAEAEDLVFSFAKQFREAAAFLRNILCDSATDNELDDWDYCSFRQVRLIEKRLNVESDEKALIKEAADRHIALLSAKITTPPTPVQKPTTNSVSTNTDPPSPPKDKGKAPSKATPPPTTTPPRTNKGKTSAKATPPPTTPPGTNQNPPSKGKGKMPLPSGAGLSPPPTLAKTMVLHAAPTKFKPGQMRRWIEEDNKSTGVQILGIRWLTQEHRRAGKMASSLVIYMKERINIDQGLRMGRRFFRTTVYDWSR